MFVLGGCINLEESKITNTTEFFDRKRNIWLEFSPMIVERAEFDSIILFSFIFVFFGKINSELTSSIEYFNFDNSRWEIINSDQQLALPKLKNHKVLKLNFCSVIIIGGESAQDHPNFDFFIIDWKQGFTVSPIVTKLENKLHESLLYPSCSFISKDLLIFGSKSVLYKFDETLNFLYSKTENELKTIKKPLYNVECDFDYNSSSNQQFENSNFKNLLLFGIESHPKVYLIDSNDFSWEIMKMSSNFVFQDFSCSICLNDGRVLFCGVRVCGFIVVTFLMFGGDFFTVVLAAG